MFNRLNNFMMGRNGMDAMNLGLLLGAVVLNLIGVLTRSNTVYSVLRILSTLLLVFAIYRMFSRRLEARRKENARFLSLTAGVRTWFANLRGGAAGDRSHKYFTCPGCRNRLRVPAGKGTIEITCPRCGTRFSGKS